MHELVAEEACHVCSAVLRIGGLESATFRGMLSLVQVWDVARESTGIRDIFNAKATVITSHSYTQGLIADWSWDSFQPGPGMKKTSSSTRGQKICRDGQKLDYDGSSCINKTASELTHINHLCHR